MPKKGKPKRAPNWVYEGAWRKATEPAQLAPMLREMLRFGFTGVTARKCSLCEIACAHRVAHLFPDGAAGSVLEFATRAVEQPGLHQAERGELLAALMAERRLIFTDADSGAAANYRLAQNNYAADLLKPEPAPEMLGHFVAHLVSFTHNESREAEGRAQIALFRDIFGNPFRPVSCRPEWRTETAVLLAQRMYESRDFSAMPILADALQDAGCERAEVLDHCRDVSQVHVRGCWVIDLVLGKN